MAFNSNALTPEFFLKFGSGLLSGNTGAEQLANATSNAAGVMDAQKEQQKQTLQLKTTADWLADKDPQLSAMVRNGSVTPVDAYKSYNEKALAAQKAKQPDYQFMNVDGRIVRTDKNSGNFEQMADYSKPDQPASVQEFEYAKQNGYTGDIVTYQRDKAARANDDYASRQAAAKQIGLTESDPGYKTFILTGNIPREGQQALTAVDKKAILEADDMVAVNEGAISALQQAKKLSSSANAGWLSGTRATLGQNLPDWMVPDQVSSPDSSAATQDFDNAIVGQALTQLKAIFGGAPTEGERKILLDLQGSSNLQPEVREKIIDRAIQMAERRLEFNRQRAADMRGGDYYKPNRTDAKLPANPVNPVGTTQSGIKFTVEP